MSRAFVYLFAGDWSKADCLRGLRIQPLYPRPTYYGVCLHKKAATPRPPAERRWRATESDPRERAYSRVVQPGDPLTCSQTKCPFD